jgi:hypothetical protein
MKPLFICITETWLHPDINSELVTIKGYKLFRNDRRDNVSDNRRGGGTLIFASLSTVSRSVDLPLHICKPSGIECNLVEFVDDYVSKKAFLLCAYLPPGLKAEIFLSFVEYISVCFDFVLSDNPDAVIYVCGDFNRYDLTFLRDDYDLSNIVNFPTYGSATLDKFFCSLNMKHFFHAASAPGLGTASFSHSVVVVSRKLLTSDDFSTGEERLRKVYDLRSSFVTSFCNVLASADWSMLRQTSHLETCVNIFYDKINNALSVIPVSFVSFTPKTKPWITPVLKDLINKRWAAYRKKNFPLFCHYKKKVKDEIVKSKKIWSKRMCNSPKGMWSVVNDVRGKHDVNSADHIASLFADRSTAVESINDFFSKCFSKSQMFPILPVRKNVNSICDEDVVFSFLRKLRTDKASGGDGLLPVLLKKSADFLSQPLCIIINLSFEQGAFPRIWKAADIFPIPKTNPVRADQLRPVSLLPTMSKICEKVILNVYRAPLLQCYDKCQFAYRPLSSTVCALISIHDCILKLLDDVNVCAVRLITFDMSRAFDSIPHHLLLSHLSKLSLPNCNSFVNWLNSYLSDRKQRVKLGNTKSSLTSVTSGVPQGSVLGPLLFAVYLSSYEPYHNTVHVFKYADDISLIVPVLRRHNYDASIVNDEIVHFKDWCKNHGMSINFSKSKILNINLSHLPLAPVLSLEAVPVLKILGLVFNEKLAWSDHFDLLGRKLSQRLYVLRVLKKVLDHDMLVTVFNSIIQSVMDYASPVFLNCTDSLNKKFLSICKRAFRVIHGFDVRECDKCNILDIVQRRKLLALRLFKSALFFEHHALHDIIPPFSHRSRRIILPHVKASRRLESFVFRCSVWYNESL